MEHLSTKLDRSTQALVKDAKLIIKGSKLGVEGPKLEDKHHRNKDYGDMDSQRKLTVKL